MERPPGASLGTVLVTGANGHLGLGLMRRVAREPGRAQLLAVVRSARAAETIGAEPASAGVELRVVDTRDEGALAGAAQGAACWVHLVGILKETKAARYEEAHERSAARVARAAEKAGVGRIVYLSILGADPESANACLASKGRAEQTLLSGAVAATVLRVPMVLGPGELAAAALRGQASAPVTFLVRGGATREQPIDSEDVAEAILRALSDGSRDPVALDLAGPKSLSHRELVLRVAQRLGRRPRVAPVPLAAARLAAALLGRLANPPLTPAMLGVLEHDDDIDPAPACARLGLALTPLDDTLDRTFGAAPGRDA